MGAIRLLEKFQPDSFKTERLVCVETDGQIDSSSHADQEYIYFMGSETVLTKFRRVRLCYRNTNLGDEAMFKS